MSEEKQEVTKEEVPAIKQVVINGSINQLGCLIKARMPLIQVITHDEERFLRELYNNLCKEKKYKLFFWSAWQGVVEYVGDKTLFNPQRASGDWDKSWAPNTALELILKYTYPKSGDNKAEGAIFVMRDFNTVLAQPIPRMMRDMYMHCVLEGKTILCMGGSLTHGPGASKSGIEPSLEKQMVVYRWTLPTRKEIEAELRSQIGNVSDNKKKKVQVKYTDEEFYQFSRSLQGLTFTEIDNSTAISVAELGKLDSKRLLDEKKQIIMRSEILEYIDSSSNLQDIGGIDNLKDYVAAHSNSHSEEAFDFGVDPIKGILLTGIPGTGKSVSAKAIGNTWGVPTLRLDIGKVMTGLVGGSEEKMRAVVQQAASVAPCVLWLDEIEKALSGTKSSNFSDGGTLARVFGTLLTAMEEGMQGVTMIATANDISALPPELIRRFSEVFFVGLPTVEERAEIFAIHLKKKKRDPKDFDLNLLAQSSNKYTGAEIEKAVKEAIARCFNDGKRKVETKHLISAIEDTKPIAKMMDQKIKDLEDWARNKARFASSQQAEEMGLGKQKIITKSGQAMSIADLDNDLPEVKKKAPKKYKNTSRLNAIAESEDDE